ncbi:MAG: acetyl-CoA carboxylase biotin carboxyl carrier protein [Hyphomicrobiales bacterium]
MSLSFKEVAEILKIIDASNCDEVVLELEGIKLAVRRDTSHSQGESRSLETPVTELTQTAAPSAPQTRKKAPTAEASTASGVPVRSPMVGSFYRRPAPDKPPFVEVGSKVKQGDTLCLIDVMKLYTTITATHAGTVNEIAADDGDLVEFDQLLFVISAD